MERLIGGNAYRSFHAIAEEPDKCEVCDAELNERDRIMIVWDPVEKDKNLPQVCLLWHTPVRCKKCGVSYLLPLFGKDEEDLTRIIREETEVVQLQKERGVEDPPPPFSFENMIPHEGGWTYPKIPSPTRGN